ncbi:MAG TPA: three-Cys-motif partner protein TcmP [Nitrospira sp.]|nr:three-Cys-motif partner protein TcmP [Nitrospira sp.]MCW5796007.1 three-Cys-motif partner protein TcmP [Nitrospira sp.]HMV56407.1 three-Cys-motif partner protein TcmP [Nitrospira sp.]HMW86600.1 three-Cys-motif partner protein TcmP [Nitrospira sp.]HNC84935.1 three-Cys-motif partner protein TcmP [Nitrospira sp.]
MSSDDFHGKPFDEGTVCKLHIFELYAREWFPVFLSSEKPRRKAIHVFDFFAGPGTDRNNVLGSPLRLLSQLQDYQGAQGWEKVAIHAHFYDEDSSKIARLQENIASRGLRLSNVHYDIRALRFDEAFQGSDSILADTQAAKLVFIDQTGVAHVTTEVFRKLVSSPTCDFLFFLSSSTLHRFRDHPAIWQKIDRPEDYYQVHRAALEYYRGLLPHGQQYYLAPFSIKKGANIYGIIFGSAHPLGIDKFLEVAWRKDEFSGEADFPIDRENIRPGQMLLPMVEAQASKITVFENELERLLRDGGLLNEVDVMRVCFEYGVKRRHALPILTKLRKERVIDVDFLVPDIQKFRCPRPIRMRK